MQYFARNMAVVALLLSVALFEAVSTASWYTLSDGRTYLIETSTSVCDIEDINSLLITIRRKIYTRLYFSITGFRLWISVLVSVYNLRLSTAQRKITF